MSNSTTTHPKVGNVASSKITDTRVGYFNLSSDGPSETQPGDTSCFYQVSFGNDLIGEKFTVIPMVQTFNGSNTPGIRIANVTKSGFLIYLNEVVVTTNDDGTVALSDGRHFDETIGYVAYGWDKEKS